MSSFPHTMPLGSTWAHYGWKNPLVVYTVIAYDENKAIVRCEDKTAAGTIYHAVDEHEFDTWVKKTYTQKI